MEAANLLHSSYRFSNRETISVVLNDCSCIHTMKPFALLRSSNRGFEGGTNLQRLPQGCSTTCCEIQAHIYRILNRVARPDLGSSATITQWTSKDSLAEEIIQLTVKITSFQWRLLLGNFLKLRPIAYRFTSISPRNVVQHRHASVLLPTPLEQTRHQRTLVLSSQIQEHWS